MIDINDSGIDSDDDGDGRNFGDDDDGDGSVDDGDDSDDDGDDSNGGDGGGGGATLPSTPCRQSNGTGLHTQFRRVQKLTKTIIDFFRWKKYYNSIMLLFPGLPDGEQLKEKVQNCSELISNSCKFGDKSTKTGILDSLMVALLLMKANIPHNMDVK